MAKVDKPRRRVPLARRYGSPPARPPLRVPQVAPPHLSEAWRVRLLNAAQVVFCVAVAAQVVLWLITLAPRPPRTPVLLVDPPSTLVKNAVHTAESPISCATVRAGIRDLLKTPLTPAQEAAGRAALARVPAYGAMTPKIFTQMWPFLKTLTPAQRRVAVGSS